MTSLFEEARAGLYVHVPFCVSRCNYCAFASDTQLAPRPDYLAGLAREAAMRAPTWGRFDTLYVGGGTPSALGLAGLERLVRALEPLELTPDASWTVEVNPDDASAELFRGLVALGFERVSLGVQSLDDRALRFLGRRHDAQAAVDAATAAREAGVEDLGLDLIFALPGQSVRHWTLQLERALELEPTHLSCYELTVEPDTPLARAVDGHRVAMPDDDRCRELFLAGSQLLRGRGWDHYEVSNYARAPRLRARHNEKYWQHRAYLGLGPAAHSFDGLHRWWNHRELASWAECLDRRAFPAEQEELLDASALRLERLALGFRHHGGVPLEDLAGSGRALELAILDGLVVQRGQRLHPTPLGYLLADALALRFA